MILHLYILQRVSSKNTAILLCALITLKQFYITIILPSVKSLFQIPPIAPIISFHLGSNHALHLIAIFFLLIQSSHLLLLSSMSLMILRVPGQLF